MNDDCLICNTRLGPGKTKIENVFHDVNVMPSSNTLLRTLQEILDKPLNENEIHSKSMCKKCYRSCVNYDEYMSKMKILKMDMCAEFNTTIHTSRATPSMPVLAEEKPKTPIVVPASKLKPIPADFQLNFGSAFHLGQKAKIVTKSGLPSINLKVTIGTSVLTQSLNTTTVKISAPETTVSTVNTLSTVSVNDISKKWDVSVPQEIFSSNEETSQSEMIKTNGDEENEMDVEEECNLPVVPMTPDDNDPLFEGIKSESGSMPEFTEFITITEGADGAAGNYVFGKLKIFNSKDGNDEQQTLVIDGDNASVLEMMTGQKVIYENGGLSLVMENDDAAGDAAEDDDDDDDDDDDEDGQDSNEESQIELQVSGDEETANAIIAAAQEQGGAFIKVESGEMYRVQSVQSHDSNHDVASLLTRHGNQFSCNLCQRHDTAEKNKLRDASAMMLHLKSDHDAKVYLCQFCGKGMRKRTDYTTHLAEHARKPLNKSSAQRRIHECALCNKFYTSRTLLHEHMNTHTGARPYTCDECDKAFASKYSLRAHLKIHQARPRPFQCEQCNKSFLSAQNLKQHEKTHSGLREFVCKFCNKAFSTQHNLEIHSVVHTGVRPFSCQFCVKSFARRAELMDHRRTHTGERPFECEVCGARFAQRSNLHSHRRATHLNDKRHQCPDCPKRFKRRRLLQYHIKATHTGERPLKCEVCLASFVYPEHYKKHLKIHSGARPFVCEICGKSFNSRDNRNMHRFTHSEKKPYECLACGHSYMRKRLLIAHMNATGHLAESIVVNQPRVTRVLKTDGVTTLVDVEKRAEAHSDKTEAVLRTSGKVESLDKLAAILPRQEPPRLLPDVSFIDTENLETGAEQTVVVKEISATEVQQDAVHYGTDENGSVLRLIQVKLPDGNDGWMALND